MKILILLVILSAWPVCAQTENTMLNNAAAICYPALPVYDGNVRKRPLAVFNEGKISSFVTCAFTVREEAHIPSGGVERFGVMLKNQNNTPKTIRCVAVVGVDNGTAYYVIQSDTLNPGERAYMEWNAGPYVGQNMTSTPVGLSCLLPVLTGINETRIHWDALD